MKIIAATVIATAVLAAAPAFAGESEGATLARKSNCMPACHTQDKKILGPAYQDVAKKYAGDKGAEAMLFDRVKKGSAATGGNKWPGPPIPMPPNSGVKDEDIHTLVKWVLAGAK